MNIEANDVIAQLGDASSDNAAIVHQLHRIDNAVRAIAVVIILPVVVKLVVGVVGGVVGARYVNKYGATKALPKFQHDVARATGVSEASLRRASVVE